MTQSELLRKCTRNDRSAQQELYRLYAPAMLGICYRYTKSTDDAEDVLQEGFIKVFSNLTKYKGEGELAAWMGRIFINTSLSYLKRHRRYRNHMDFSQPGIHPVTDDEVNIKLNTEELIELIRRLPAGYQVIFNMVAIEDFSHVEVSKMLGINENTCRSQYSRARAMLIRWINEEETALIKKISASK